MTRPPASELAMQVFLNRPTKLMIKRIRAGGPDNQFSSITTNVLAKKRVPALSRDWFALRGRLLTASRMAACLGQNSYCKPDSLFLELTHQSPQFKGNVFTQWGQKYESEAADVYSALTGLELVEEEIGFMIHDYEKKEDPGRKRYGATPDFITKNGIVVEIKCPYKRRITHHIPPYYMAQVQMQLEVCNAPVAHFVQYLPPSENADGIMDIYQVMRDPSWWSRSLPEFDDFWDTVIMWYRERDRELGEKNHSTVPDCFREALEPKYRMKDEKFAFVKK